MAKPTKAARNSKTPAERAQEALDTANRVVDRAEKRLTDAKAEVVKLEGELEAAGKRRDYLAQNPDLPAQTGDPVSGYEDAALDGGTP